MANRTFCAAMVLWILATSAVICDNDAFQDQPAFDSEEEQQGFDAISSLHLQLDDDADGKIDKSESDEFLREELNYVHGYGSRQELFHQSDQSQDTSISLRELWDHWHSAVHNWTTEQTVDWLVTHVHLPQYSHVFTSKGISGRALPRLAVNNNHYLSGVLGIKDPRHKQKIMLKAMDAVLFGPPKDPTNWVKDVVLLSLVVISLAGCWLVYQQNKKFQKRMRKMTADMDSLGKAETALLELQKELDRANEEKEAVSSQKRHLEQRLISADSGSAGPGGEESELERLRSEVEILTEALRTTEAELEDRCWNCPPALQHWLQLTHELELAAHNRKRAQAESQLEQAKIMCDKLRKKQNSLYGAFVSTHGRTVNDVDTSIAHARRALLEVTQELQERTYRWRQIEMICGFDVIHNPGLPYLQSLTKTLQKNSQAGLPRAASSLAKSDDDLDDDATTFRASASSSALLADRSRSSSSLRHLERDSSQSSVKEPTLRHQLERDSSQSSVRDPALRQLERDSSQSSYDSTQDADPRVNSIAAFAESFRPPRPLSAALVQQQRSPALRRGNMVKSHSHDAAVPSTAAATAAGTAKDTELQSSSPLVSRSESDLDSAGPAGLTASSSQQLSCRLRQLASSTPSTVDEEDGAGTDSSSVTEENSEPGKHRHKFRLFRRNKVKAQ